MRLGRDVKRLILRVACLGALLVTVSGAQTLPEPPADSDLAIRILPVSNYQYPVDADVLRRHPLPRLLERTGERILGVKPLAFFNQTFEGTFVAAIVSRDGSSLTAYSEDRDARRDWSSMQSELESLVQDLRSHAETEGEYPADLPKFLEEVRYYEPYLPDGADYNYQRLNDGKDFRITAVFEKGSKLETLGPAPIYSSSETDRNLEPTAPPIPLNIMMAAKVQNTKQLKAMLSRMFGAPKDGFWRTEKAEGLSLHITLRGEWLVASDQISNLGGFLDTLNGVKPGWSSNSRFEAVARNLDEDSPFLFFVDTPKILASGDMPPQPEAQRLISLVGPIGYSVAAYGEGQYRIEAFVGVDAPEGSELKTFLTSSKSHGATPVTVGNIPWDVSNVFALDYGSNKELLDSVLALFPEFSNQIDMGQDVAMGMLGLDAEAGLDRLFTGPVIVSFERIDVITNAIETVMGVVEDKKFGAGDTEEEGKKENPFGYVPATFAFQVPVANNRGAAERLLAPYMGDDISTEELYGVEIRTSEDGRLAYAIDGDWMYISGGRTDRLMVHMLEAAHGRKETLGSIDSWSRFTVGTRGRLLAFGHQKVDAVYSIVMGLLLFMGSDYRPAAEEVGKLRDYHSVMTAVPDGLMLVGEIVRGDDR